MAAIAFGRQRLVFCGQKIPVSQNFREIVRDQCRHVLNRIIRDQTPDRLAKLIEIHISATFC